MLIRSKSMLLDGVLMSVMFLFWFKPWETHHKALQMFAATCPWVLPSLALSGASATTFSQSQLRERRIWRECNLMGPKPNNLITYFYLIDSVAWHAKLQTLKAVCCSVAEEKLVARETSWAALLGRAVQAEGLECGVKLMISALPLHFCATASKQTLILSRCLHLSACKPDISNFSYTTAIFRPRDKTA